VNFHTRAEQQQSRRGPRQQHYLAAEPAGIDPSMDLKRGREGQAVDDHRMNDAIAKQVEQSGHVSLELIRVRQSAGGDAVEHRATAAVQASFARAAPSRRGMKELTGALTLRRSAAFGKAKAAVESIVHFYSIRCNGWKMEIGPSKRGVMDIDPANVSPQIFSRGVLRGR
jgi:hypothetical protein